jgi:protein SCO1/2
MIQFIRNSLLALLLFGCIQKKLAQLPFFNKPDFTPEWIEPGTNAYQAIHTIPSFLLLDQRGEAITEKTTAGKIYVANFMFTSCISICPLMTDNMKMLQARFAYDPEVLLLSHSVMPDIDSVARLKKYAEQKGIIATKWHVLTGNREAIYTLAKKHYFAGDSIGFYGNQNNFLHTENFILVDKHRRIRGVYNGTLKFEMDRIIEDIELLKGEE